MGRILGRLLVCLTIAAIAAACAGERPRPHRAALPPETVPAAPPGPPVSLLSEASDGPVERPAAVVRRGSGQFVQPVAEAGGAAAAGAAGDGVTLNFVEADLREFLRAVLGETLKLSYAVDPRVQGSISVQTARPLARAQVLPLVEDLLRMNGVALVQRGAAGYQVVPMSEAARASAPRVRAKAAAAGFSTHIVPLRHVPAAEMAKLLEPFLPQDRVIRAESARNVLILSGTAQELATAEEMLAILDVDWLAGMSFGLFPIGSAKAETVAADLEKVFGDQEKGPLAGLIRLVPIERLNSVMVITSRPDYLDKARGWIEDLDRGGEAEGQRLYVYYVQNSRAADLAAVLMDVFGTDPGAAQRRAAPRLAPGRVPAEIRSGAAYGRTAPPGAPAAAGGMTAATAGAPGLATAAPAGSGGLSSVLGDLNQRIEGAGPPPTGESRPAAATAGIRIIADEKTNALVIMASPRQFQTVESALRRLDIVPLQVLIEATIAEVTLTDDLRYGVQWFLQEGNHSLSLSEVSSGVPAQLFPGFSYLFAGGDYRVVINALSSVTDVNVISAPHVLVLDNQTARLQVGDEVPVATQSAVSVIDPSAPIVNSISFRDTGVILEVTPRVNASGLVIMDVRQEVSEVAPNVVSGIDSPTIRQRNVASTVAVQSGETIALGGLIRDNRSRGQSGLPVLSALPLIGPLFGATNDNSSRTELLVLLTPRVIRSPHEARQATDELRRRMNALNPLGERIDGGKLR